MMQSLQRLEEIFEHQVFELCGPFGRDYYIPYMMNDALEYYLILKNCRMVGEYVHKEDLFQTMQVAQDETGYVMAVRQGNENAFTLYFETIEESLKFYQYHEIGHFWVKGQEQWRQLVYIIGTIYDKFQYLGEWSCTDKELDLLPVIEFAPFRDWSPIHESLDEFYPDTYEGIEVMRSLALEAGDQEYARLISLYERFQGKAVRRLLAEKLLSVKRQSLYQLLWQKVEAASKEYPKRQYPKEMAEKITKIRQQVDREWKDKGFEGTYPVYRKGTTQILVTEEHPFTTMEWEYYQFQIQFMVSECEDVQCRNGGFFRGPGRKGWIEKYESI